MYRIELLEPRVLLSGDALVTGGGMAGVDGLTPESAGFGSESAVTELVEEAPSGWLAEAGGTPTFDLFAELSGVPVQSEPGAEGTVGEAETANVRVTGDSDEAEGAANPNALPDSVAALEDNEKGEISSEQVLGGAVDGCEYRADAKAVCEALPDSPVSEGVWSRSF
ncbi:MAG: LEPR-XLL domain-containing protein [Verrucomicrobiota bacterium]|nr:LEPR-XLL domain-containing protein [Verrucomicrobiota bacterium]